MTHISKEIVDMTEPYIPGFLAFREVSFLMDRLEEIKENNPHLMPQVTSIGISHLNQFFLVEFQVIMVDGNGILHPRGIAFSCWFM